MSPDDQEVATTAPEPSADKVSPRQIAKAVVLAVVAVALIVLAVPAWASLTYRSAVRDLHEELAALDAAGSVVVDAGAVSCVDGFPLSVRRLEPVDGTDQGSAVMQYGEALSALGFTSQGGAATATVGQRWSRERDDDLDGDVVVIRSLEDEGAFEVSADVVDGDMVFCLPF